MNYEKEYERITQKSNLKPKEKEKYNIRGNSHDNKERNSEIIEKKQKDLQLFQTAIEKKTKISNSHIPKMTKIKKVTIFFCHLNLIF